MIVAIARHAPRACRLALLEFNLKPLVALHLVRRRRRAANRLIVPRRRARAIRRRRRLMIADLFWPPAARKFADFGGTPPRPRFGRGLPLQSADDAVDRAHHGGGHMLSTQLRPGAVC